MLLGADPGVRAHDARLVTRRVFRFLEESRSVHGMSYCSRKPRWVSARHVLSGLQRFLRDWAEEIREFQKELLRSAFPCGLDCHVPGTVVCICRQTRTTECETTPTLRSGNARLHERAGNEHGEWTRGRMRRAWVWAGRGPTQTVLGIAKRGSIKIASCLFREKATVENTRLAVQVPVFTVH